MDNRLVVLAGLVLLTSCSDASEPPVQPDKSAISATATSETRAAQSASGLAEEAEDWVRATYAGEDTLMYRSGSADLDGDGIDELLVYPGGPMLCGSGGCNLIVLRKDGEEWREVSELTVVQLPVGVLDTSSNGWRDLWVTVGGGGIPQATMKVPFDGKAYQSNPTVAPAELIDKPGAIVIAEGELIRLN